MLYLMISQAISQPMRISAPANITSTSTPANIVNQRDFISFHPSLENPEKGIHGIRMGQRDHMIARLQSRLAVWYDHLPIPYD